jgi:outer membrane autotransporter protein
VGGTATLAGTLSLLYAPGTYTTKTYTLVSAGSVSGTFSTVKGNTPSGLTQSMAYGLTTGNLDLVGSSAVQPVVVAPTQATIFGAVGSSALRAGQGANEVLLDRLAGPCGVAVEGASARAAAAGGQGSGAATAGTSGASAAGTSYSTTQSLTCPRQGNGLWIQAQGTDTRVDGNNSAPDARDRRYGFLTGVDHQWKGMTVGVAGGYSHADVTESGNGSKGTLDTLRLAGYGAKNLGAYTLAGTLGYAYDFSSTSRSFGALGSAKGDGHGQEFTAGLQVSRAWSLGPVVLTPRVGVRYAYLDGLSTNETGPTAQNLGVGSQHLQSLQPYVGVTLDYPFTLRNNDRPASIQLRAGYAYETQSTGRDVSVTAADGTGFVIAGTRDTRGLVTAGLGATLPIGKSASAYVRYDSVLHTGNVNAQSLQAGVDYRF